MATAPVVIPYAVTQLVTGFVADATLTTAQALFTAPNGCRAVVTAVVQRNASAAVNALTTWSAGFDAAAVNVYPAGQTTAQGLQASAQYSFTQAPAITSTTSPFVGQSAQTFSLKYAGTQTGNGKVVVDVLGYIEAL
jgi:hypothetical protein